MYSDLLMWVSSTWTIKEPQLPYKTGLDVTQSHSLRRMRFGQYQATWILFRTYNNRYTAVSFPGSPTLERKHWNCEGRESLVHVSFHMSMTSRVERVVVMLMWEKIPGSPCFHDSSVGKLSRCEHQNWWFLHSENESERCSNIWAASAYMYM